MYGFYRPTNSSQSTQLLHLQLKRPKIWVIGFAAVRFRVAGGDLSSRAKALARFLDTSTTNELAGGIKYNQEERTGAGHAFSLLHDYLKMAEGAYADVIAKLSKAKY